MNEQNIKNALVQYESEKVIYVKTITKLQQKIGLLETDLAIRDSRIEILAERIDKLQQEIHRLQEENNQFRVNQETIPNEEYNSDDNTEGENN